MDEEETLAQSLRFLRELRNGNDSSSSTTPDSAATATGQEKTPNCTTFAQTIFLKSYTISPEELSNEIADFVRSFLEDKKCPHVLALFLARCMQEKDFLHGQDAVHSSAIFNEVLETFQKMIDDFLSEPSFEMELRKLLAIEKELPHDVSTFAIRNKRRKMEDRHVVIRDLNTLLGMKNAPVVHSYYAVFDGHAGVDAASYAAAHFHMNLAKDQDFFSDPSNAMENAYRVTDENFCKKALTDGIKSGCTAVTALIRDKTLCLAWLGDSQAILVDRGKPITIMNPHKPNREDEKKRIEDLGGFIHHLGTWRVNGSLAVSRAIGDFEFKPFVNSEAEVNVVPLNGNEDFLVLACDGLWDALTPNDVASMLYSNLNENICANASVDTMAEKLVHQSKQQGSDDNITVLVVYLRHVSEILADANQRILHQTVDETNFPIGETHCPERPKVLENIISFPSLCPKSEGEQSDMAAEAIEPTEFSELPTPPIDDIKNHFTEYYSQSQGLEKPMEQEDSDYTSLNIEGNNPDTVVSNECEDLSDLLTGSSDGYDCEAPVLNVNTSAADLMEIEATTVSQSITTEIESIHSELNPDAEAFIPKFCNVGLSSVVQEVKTEEFQSFETVEKSVNLVENYELKSDACIEDENIMSVVHEVKTEEFQSYGAVEKSVNFVENYDLKGDACVENENIMSVVHEVKTEEFQSYGAVEKSLNLVENYELKSDACVENENIVDLMTSELNKNVPDVIEIRCFDNAPEQVVSEINLLDDKPNVQDQPIEVPVAEEYLVDHLKESKPPVDTGTDVMKDEVIIQSEISQDFMAPVILPEPSSIVSEISQNLKEEKVENLINAVNVIQNSDASSTELPVAVDLQSVPDGIPEAEGVCEDIDSDSEKDGGWSYMKAADNVVDDVSKAQQSEGGDQKVFAEGITNKTKPETPKSGGKLLATKQRAPRVEPLKKSDSASKSTVPVKRSPVVPKMPVKAAGVLSNTSQAQASKISRTQPASKALPAAKVKTSQPSTTDNSKTLTKTSVSMVKKETTLRNTSKPSAPAIKKELPNKAAPVKPSLTAPKTTSPATQKSVSPALSKVQKAPLSKPVSQTLKLKPVTSPSGIKPSNPTIPQKVGLSSTVQKTAVKKSTVPPKPVSTTRNVAPRANAPISSAAPKRNLQATKPNSEMKETKNAVNKQLVTKRTGVSSSVSSTKVATAADTKRQVNATALKTSAVLKSKKMVTTSTIVAQPKKANSQQTAAVKKIANCKSNAIKDASSISDSNNGNQQVEMANQESKSSTEKFILECDIKESVVETIESDLSSLKITSECSEIPQVVPEVSNIESDRVLTPEVIVAATIESEI